MIEGLKWWRARRRFNKFLSFSEQGWLLVQSGKTYTLYPLNRDTDADAFYIETDDGREYYEDNLGMIRSLNGFPFGIATDRGRPIVDAEAAKTAAAMDQKDDEDRQLTEDSHLKVSDIMQHMTVGELHPRDSEKSISIINPFHHIHDEPDIVDVRPVARLFRRSARPDTPRKAAKNAVEAERASQGLDLGTVGQTALILTSAFVGGLLTYIGFTASGGGGGIALPLIMLL
ncbi:MAG TPA: hypothetical protein VKA06_10745 [Spirochaetia bacterium]|jgi:hypothetical protein|nr:hypothetical protein [Spirochaetia bacterium]